MKNVFSDNEYIYMFREKVICNILHTIHKSDRNLSGYAYSYIKNNLIIVIAVTTHDEDSEGKLYFLVGERGTRSVSKCARREIAARNGSAKEGNGRKNLGKKGGERAVAVATPSAITMP